MSLTIVTSGQTGGGGSSPKMTVFASIAALQAAPSVGLSVGSTFGVLNGTIYQVYTLVSGGAGLLPNDYNASTNNVSYNQSL